MAQTVYQILLKLEGQKQAKEGLEQIGTVAGLTGAAMLAFQGAATKTAADYQFALQKVQTVAGDATGSASEFDAALADLSNQMDGNLGKAEAAAASYDILSAGYKDQADVLAILEQSQKAAIGGFSDIATVSDAATTIMNAYGDQLGENLTVTEKVTLITDQMIATQNNGKITVGEYAGQIGMLASTAATAKIPFDQLNGVIATSTSKGVQSSQTIAGLGQVISNIAKPTLDAANEAKRLGIEFDAAALESQGLLGILQNITESGGATSESLFKLFGSTEAVKVVSAVAGENLGLLEENVRSAGNAAQLTEGAYGDMADTVSVKADAALKTLNNTLIDLGQGTLVALEPAIDALQFLVSKFNELPGPVKSSLGLIIAATGGLLTVAGAVTLLSTAWVSTTTSMAAASKVVAVLSKALLAKAGAAAAAAKSTAALNLALLPLAATIGAAVAAVAALTLAWKQYQNIRIEQKNQEIRNAQIETQGLANAATKLGLRMQESGEAIPDDEYERFMGLLKETNAETGELDGIIGALERTQAKYKSAAEGSSDATQDLTQATGEAALSAEDQAKAEEEAAAAIQGKIDAANQAIGVISRQTQAQVAAVETQGLSEEESINRILELRRGAAAETQTILSNTLAVEGLNKGQIVELETQKTETVIALATEEFRAKERLAQLNLDRQKSIIDSQIALAEQASLGSPDSPDNLSNLASLNQQKLQIEQDFLNAKLRATKAGSAEEANLVAKINQLSLQSAQIRTRLEEDITRAKKAQLDTQLADAQAANDIVLQINANALSLVEAQASNLNTTSQFTESFTGQLQTIQGLLNSENLSNENRNRLLGVSTQALGELRSLGVDINQNLTTEQQIASAINQIEKLKVQFKLEQLELTCEQTRLNQQSKAIELNQERQIQEAKLASGALTEAEQRRARLDLQIANNKIEALGRENTLIERGFNLRQKELEIDSQIASIQADINETRSSQQRTQGSGSGGSRGRSRRRPEITAGLSFEEASQRSLQAGGSEEATRDVANKQNETTQAIRETGSQSVAQLTQLSQRSAITAEKARQQAQAASGSLSSLRDIGGTLRTLTGHTQTIVSQLNDIRALVGQLPGNIAARLPKPSPPPRDR